MVEFYLNKIKKVIALDEQATVVLRQILGEFYGEATRSEDATKVWMEGYREGKRDREEAED
jgi:hypothetical protein